MPQTSAQNWNPPDGLGYSSLRPVRLTNQGKFIAALIAVFLIGGFVLGILLARTIKRETQQQQLLDQQGITIDATVTRLWRDRDKEQAPHVAYRYEYEGSIYTGSVKAPTAKWRALTIGQRLSIRFVPSRPALSHPVDWAWRSLPFWFPYFVTAMFAALAVLLAFVLASQIRLLTEGRAAPGRVTAIRHAKGIVVRYEFESRNGSKFKGRSQISKIPPPGEPVCILYDPERPRRNAIYPLPLVRLDR